MKKIVVSIFLLFSSSGYCYQLKALYKGSFYQKNLLTTDFNGKLLQALVYIPNKTAKAILIVSPTIVGVTPIESVSARYFSKNDFLVIVPLPFENEVNSLHPNVDNFDIEFLRPAEFAVKFITIIDQYLSLDSELPVFALGASQGGIHSLIIASHVPRVKAAWIASTGGDLPSIYAYSTAYKIRLARARMMQDLNFVTSAQYEEYLRQKLKSDPLQLCSRIYGKLVQTISLKDSKVPTKNQLELAHACKPDQLITLNSGHLVGTMSILNYRANILQFFNANL